MNELGIHLAWLAVQVTLLVVPSLALHVLASRRGPASGAWVAALSLGLVLVLSVAALIAGPGRERERPAKGAEPHAPAHADAAAPGIPPSDPGDFLGPDRSRPPVGHGWELSGLRRAWARFERGAAEPAARCRPWGGILAVVALAGTGVGLLRLITGLWAVRICRRHGRVVDDPGMTGLLDELRGAMRCLSPVELCEVADLTTPATAGWRRPVLLLPDDWRSWNASERRAVLAHELAHIIRGDYAAGLLARLAVVLNYYHPVVRWIAGRLQLQQEQAADALGARFAGGRASYLLALSRLALKQDGRSPSWPAREFLPGRRILIRRIEMLRDQSGTRTYDRPSSGAWRLATSFTLLGLTVGVATLRGPARGDEGEAPATAASKVRTTSTRAAGTPLSPPYVGDGMAGLIAFRPAAALRLMDRDHFEPLISDIVGVGLSELSEKLKVDTSRPGFRKLGFEDIEWVTCGIRFGRSKNDEGDDLHSIILEGLTVHTAAPFDWLALLRQWRFDFAEVREGGRVYYKITGPWQEILGRNPCVYLIDDRTAVFDREKPIRTLLGRETPPLPAYLRGPDWDRVSRGLLAVAISNQDGAFAKQYDLGRADDAVVLSLFEGVDHWTLGVDDADSIALHAAAACRSGEAREAITRVIDSLLKLGRAQIEHPDPEALAVGAHEQRIHGMAKGLLASLRVRRTDRSVELGAEGFGTLADFASLIAAEANNGEEVHGQGEGTGRNAPSGRMDRHDK